MKNYNFRILDEEKKQFEITYNGKILRFQLKIKRSFTVMKELLNAYPEFINIHILDGKLNDPNRAHSDLRIGNGFSNFLIEKRGKHKVMYVKIDVEKLFKYYGHSKSDEFISLSLPQYRDSLTEQQKSNIYNKFGGKCSITGIKLCQKLKDIHFFCKSLVQPTYDHRRPVSKGGTDEIENWQLLSIYENAEKNKICNVCNKNACEKCALAYPEKFDIIQANNQDISNLKIWK
ncbi:MAG: HNH endonuclease signature motif containing protein [Elusimicrobiota bacterium]